MGILGRRLGLRLGVGGGRRGKIEDGVGILGVGRVGRGEGREIWGGELGIRRGGGVGRLDRIGERKFARVRVRTRVWDRWRRVPVGVIRRAAIAALLHLRRRRSSDRSWRWRRRGGSKERKKNDVALGLDSGGSERKKGVK